MSLGSPGRPSSVEGRGWGVALSEPELSSCPRKGESFMEGMRTRQSDRIAREIPIEISGVDCLGNDFFERTHTLVVASCGAKLVLSRKLIPEQEIVIRCLATGKEAEALVVGLIEQGKEGFHYGVRILGPTLDLWDIEFSSVEASGESVGRILLQCTRCKASESVHLDVVELEVLEATGGLVRRCHRCADSNMLRKSLTNVAEPEGRASALAEATAPVGPKERRSEPRRPMRVKACVRTANAGNDIVTIRDVSRHGLCFVSPGKYFAGDDIEVAVPYSPDGGNIFLRARIVRVQLSPSEDFRMYGVAYR